MDTNAIKDAVTPLAEMHGSSGSDASVLGNAQSLWHEWLGLTHDRLQLAGLEAQQAGLSLVNMVIAGVGVASLLGTAWLGILAVAVLGMVEYGVMAKSALLLAVALNLLLALILVRVIRQKSHRLQFPASLCSLNHNSPEHGDTKKNL